LHIFELEKLTVEIKAALGGISGIQETDSSNVMARRF
jgi:hypothetical protein